jgi:protein-S-isoprenylcysteine O-methyltransferase Ste14
LSLAPPPPAVSSPRSGLARWRVPLGFLAAAVVLWFVRPTRTSIMFGLPVACAGQMLRIWAAGHLEKSREVTSSGPYRLTRHPLYAGSTLMGAGLAIASASWVVALVLGLYLATTIYVAIRTEEAYLRATFGATYGDYAAGTAPHVHRRFSVARAVRNKEYRSALRFAVISAILIAVALIRK